jgi:hypothetical protein
VSIISQWRKAADRPEFELMGIDIGKRHWFLLHYRVLQVAHRFTVLDVDREWAIRYIENPTEERDGAGGGAVRYHGHKFSRCGQESQLEVSLQGVKILMLRVPYVFIGAR